MCIRDRPLPLPLPVLMPVPAPLPAPMPRARTFVVPPGRPPTGAATRAGAVQHHRADPQLVGADVERRPRLAGLQRERYARRRVWGGGVAR
eukprot:1226293-Prymnesium_polylepis.1